MNELVRKVQTQHHTTTCRKKKGITCRFNAPWKTSMETGTVRCEKKNDETKVKPSKKVIEKVSTFLYCKSR